VASSIELFRDEYEAHITEHRCPFDPSAAALFDYTPRPARVLTAGVH